MKQGEEIDCVPLHSWQSLLGGPFFIRLSYSSMVHFLLEPSSHLQLTVLVAMVSEVIGRPCDRELVSCFTLTDRGKARLDSPDAEPNPHP